MTKHYMDAPGKFVFADAARFCREINKELTDLRLELLLENEKSKVWASQDNQTGVVVKMFCRDDESLCRRMAAWIKEFYRYLWGTEPLHPSLFVLAPGLVWEDHSHPLKCLPLLTEEGPFNKNEICTAIEALDKKPSGECHKARDFVYVSEQDPFFTPEFEQYRWPFYGVRMKGGPRAPNAWSVVKLEDCADPETEIDQSPMAGDRLYYCVYGSQPEPAEDDAFFLLPLARGKWAKCWPKTKAASLSARAAQKSYAKMPEDPNERGDNGR